ncbi:MAG: alpha/beta hydrolase [Candidatus Nanoarchaeia archaeon]
MKKTIFAIVIALIVTYLLIGSFLYFSQASLLYFPTEQNFDECIGFEDYEKKSKMGTRFYFKNNSQDTLIVYYHGNAGSACDRSRFKHVFEESGASLLFVEYAGYSNDDVKPSRDLILKDVENIHQFILESNYKNIVLYGQSIGSGAASYYASLGGVNHMILVTPFSKLVNVAQSKYKIYPANILLKERYDNVEWLKNYNNSLTIIHGSEDGIVPSRFSQQLFDETSTLNKSYILIDGRGHNDIWLSPEFQNTVKEYINTVE